MSGAPDDLLSPARVAMDVVESRVHDRLFGEPIRQVTIGRFAVLGPAGAGGMGVVFAAHDPELDRRVAIKLVAQGLVRSPKSSQARLLGEARTLARLSHPNIVTVHDVGTFEGGLYIAMEFVDGETLDQWLGRVPNRRWQEIVAVFVAAGRGLAAGHAAGVVHRDFKPSNAMIDRAGHVRVLDFGLAIESQASGDPPSDRSLTSSRGGTFLYMAPEQRAGGKASTSTDQYAFCLSLWRALHPSFHSGSDAPAWLLRVLERGIDPDPARRFPAMEPLLDALEHGEARARRRRRNAIVMALAAATAIAVWIGAGEPPSAGTDCHGFDARAARAWTTDTREGVDRALDDAEDSLATRVVWRIDEHAEALREARSSACSDPDEDAARGRLQCLDRAELELASTLARLERATPASLAAASMAVSELDIDHMCASHDAFDEAEDPKVTQLLADGNVSRRAGLVRDALDITSFACTRLAGREHSVQWARCQALRGDDLAKLGRYEEALVVLEPAYNAATEHDRSSIAVRVAEVAARSAMLLDRPEDARRWLGNLRVAAERLGDPAARVAVAVVEAEILANEHHYAEAIAIHDELARSGLLERTTVSRQVSTHLRMARYRGRLNDSAGAERELVAARELADTLPESHALVGSTHALWGQHLQLVGRCDEAILEYRIALELATRYRSAEDPMAADARGAISECLQVLGRLDEALALADENVRRAEDTNANTRLLPQELFARASIQLDRGDAIAAERDGLAALTLVESRKDGADIAAVVRRLLARASLERGRVDEARGYAEAAVAELARILGPTHPETLGATIVLAEVESAAGRHDRAVELGEGAREGLVTALGAEHPNAREAEAAVARMRLARDGRP